MNESPFNYYKDRLVGYYIYKENGVVIADTSGDDLQSDFRISVYFGISCSSKVNTGVFTDVKKREDDFRKFRNAFTYSNEI